jgi:hypothetical protein
MSAYLEPVSLQSSLVMSGPKLRTGGVKEPYPLGEFPNGFVHTVAGELSAALAIGRNDIEGKDWEQIFAKAIKAVWRPSVVGLDDILVPSLSAAWGAKTIKHPNPFTAHNIRLISGRNSPAYSYGVSDVHSVDPAELGAKVVEIWNERVAALYQKYKTLRTVILVKGPELRQVSVFEKPTVRYNSADYQWSWNKNDNLVALDSKGNGMFTWQPHGSQFTIHDSIPDYALNIEIDPPTTIATDKLLETIGFGANSYRVIPRLKA